MQMQTAQSPKPMRKATKDDIFFKSKNRCFSDVKQPFMKAIRITTKTNKLKESKIENMKIFSPQNNNGPRATHWMERIRTLSESDVYAAAFKSPQPKTSGNLEGLLVNQNTSIDNRLVTLKAKSKNSKESSDSETKEKCDFEQERRFSPIKAQTLVEEQSVQSSYSRNERNKKYTIFKNKIGSRVISEQSNSDAVTQDKTFDLAEENKRLKMENLILTKRINKLEESLRVKELLWKREFEDEKSNQQHNKSSYHEGIRHQIHMKFKKKVEDQEVRYQTENNQMKIDFTDQIEQLHEIISEMGQTINKLKNDDLYECRNMYEIIIEKDVKIEELEEKIHNLQATMKDVSNNHGDDSNYTLITCNNALRTNLKQKEKEIAMLLEENKEMKKNLKKKEIKI